MTARTSRPNGSPSAGAGFPLKCREVGADQGEGRRAARTRHGLCRDTRITMTTRTDEGTTAKERINRSGAHRRARSEVESLSEPEPTKPLVAFDALPVPVAPPLNW